MQNNQVSPYIIHRACIEDNSKILECMHEAYYPEEPTLASLGIRQNALLDEYVWKALHEGMTQVARYVYIEMFIRFLELCYLIISQNVASK